MSKNFRNLAPKNPGKTLSRLFSYFKYYKGLFFGGISFAILGSIGGIAFNAMLSPLIDSLVTNYDLAVFIKYLSILGVITLFIVLGQYVGRLLRGSLAERGIHKL